MIRCTYQSEVPTHKDDGELKRYVRKDAMGAGYSWCEKQTRSRYDYAQGVCTADDLPEAIRTQADAQRGQAFGYVDWPR
jgi:hypothetical protein